MGRRHELTGAHIDFLAFIEIPLEIALARLVRRELAGESDRLVEYIDAYEAVAATSTESSRVRWRRMPTWWSTAGLRWRPMCG